MAVEPFMGGQMEAFGRTTGGVILYRSKDSN